MDRTTNLGDGVTGQLGEEEESYWEDQGEDKGKTDRGEQVEEDIHKVCCKWLTYLAPTPHLHESSCPELKGVY